MIVNDDIGPNTKEDFYAALEAYKKFPNGLLPNAKRIMGPNLTCYRSDVDHEQVARHEAIYDEDAYYKRACKDYCNEPLRLSLPVSFWRCLRGGTWPWERRKQC